MKYVGSKNRLSKELAPIIQSYVTENIIGYLEPFVGGANMIDKIKHNNKVGCDVHKELIELLKYAQDLNNELPKHISEEEYIKVRDNKEKYPLWYVGLVGFCATFSAKYFGGYARSFKADGITPRDMSCEAIRNLNRQRENLKDIDFICGDYLGFDEATDNHLIYCDPPYRNTTKYATSDFNYEQFYDWCEMMSECRNTVLISEYWMPEDRFECIWSKEHRVGIDSNKINHSKRVEKLFIPKTR